MTEKNEQRAEQIEVWLSLRQDGIACTVVRPDESTEDLHVSALTLDGAGVEITGELLREGYAPAGPWENAELTIDAPPEIKRTFKLAEAAS